MNMKQYNLDNLFDLVARSPIKIMLPCLWIHLGRCGMQMIDHIKAIDVVGRSLMLLGVVTDRVWFGSYLHLVQISF